MSIVVLSVVVESIVVMIALFIANSQRQTSVFDLIERFVNRFEELQLNLLCNQDII